MKKKIVAFILVFALALALGIGGTMAWLTAESGKVVNTFTVGNITLELTEKDATKDADGTLKKDYKILPGATAEKEPKLTVGAGSEKCYLYACVTNDVKIGNDVVATPNISTEWVPVGTKGNATVYRYNDVIDASDEAVAKSVFTEVKYSETITQSKAHLDALTNKTIVVQGYAHQSEHISETEGDTSVADSAACAYFKVDAIVTPAN